MFSSDALNTYKHHFEVAALKRPEKVCHPRLQTTTNEDTIIDVK